MKGIYEQWVEDGVLESILTLVKKWREDGAEMNEIAKKLGISRASLFKYQSEHKDFADALKRGKEVLDAEIEGSLKKECIGYYYEETITTKSAIIDKRTGQITDLERIETKTTKKYARPSVTAIAYYLNNKAPDKWKNRVVTTIEDIHLEDDSMKEMEKYFEKKKKQKNENSNSIGVREKTDKR